MTDSTGHEKSAGCSISIVQAGINKVDSRRTIMGSFIINNPFKVGIEK
jgi:hypothetical protein